MMRTGSNEGAGAALDDVLREVGQQNLGLPVAPRPPRPGLSPSLVSTPHPGVLPSTLQEASAPLPTAPRQTLPWPEQVHGQSLLQAYNQTSQAAAGLHMHTQASTGDGPKTTSAMQTACDPDPQPTSVAGGATEPHAEPVSSSELPLSSPRPGAAAYPGQSDSNQKTPKHLGTTSPI